MSNGSDKPKQEVPSEAAFDGRAEADEDPFDGILARSIQRAFEPIVEKARRKRDAREQALGAKIDEALRRR